MTQYLFSRLSLLSLIFLWHVSAAVCVSGQESAQPKQLDKDAGFEPLFNGEDLEGWEGNLEYFRIEGDAIVAGTLERKIPNNEFLCTKKRFEDFELVLEVKLKGEGNNAGIQFRSERIAGDHEVQGYQCDVGAAWNRPVWGGLYDESRRRKMLAEGDPKSLTKWLKDGEWNELRIVAKGNRIQQFLNGHQTIDYTEEDSEIPSTGIIGLQIHSGPPTEAWYRNIRLRKFTQE